MTRLVLSIVAALALILVNGIFVAVEYAFVRVRRTRLEQLAAEGHQAARRSILLVDQLPEYLVTTQIGVTAASLGVGWLGESAFAHLFALLLPPGRIPHVFVHVFATVVSFSLVTTLHVVVGELVPKNLAIASAERILLNLGTPLELVHVILRPVRRVFALCTDAMLRLFGHRPVPEPAVTEGELMLMVEDSHQEGVVTDSEANIIARAFRFADRPAVEIMTPADRVDFLSLARSFDENLMVAERHMHARLPLCRTNLDSVIGVVSMRDVWPQLIDERSNAAFERVARPLVRVPLDVGQDAVLRLLQHGRSKMGVVRDPADERTLGVVTLDDVLESLLGDVREPRLGQ